MGKKQITPTNTPYTEFLNSFSERGIVKDFSNLERELLKHPLFGKFLDRVPCGIVVSDYQQAKYLYINDEAIKTFTGFTKEEFLKRGGVYQFTKDIQPDDKQIHATIVWPKIISILKAAKKEDIPNYKFSFNYRYPLREGTEIKVLQSSVFLETDEEHKPLLVLITVTDITKFKHDNSVSLTVSRYVKSTGVENIVSEVFIPSDLYNPLITSREIDIIRAIAQGKTSKQISEMYSISQHTVRAHRKNIFKKVNVKNSAQLTAYAQSIGVLT